MSEKSLDERREESKIEPTYPAYIITDEQLGTLMGDGAVNILKEDGSILVRLVMEKKNA